MLRGSSLSRRRRTRLEPMKPAEPVTKMVLVFCDISFFAGQGSFVGHPAIAFGSSALPRLHQPRTIRISCIGLGGIGITSGLLGLDAFEDIVPVKTVEESKSVPISFGLLFTLPHLLP